MYCNFFEHFVNILKLPTYFLKITQICQASARVYWPRGNLHPLNILKEINGIHFSFAYQFKKFPAKLGIPAARIPGFLQAWAGVGAITPKSCLIFQKFKNNQFCMVKHQYWSTNTWDTKTRSEKRQQIFFQTLFYTSGICGQILMFDHAKWIILEI